MHVPAINAVKEHLEKLKSDNQLIEAWELPYENLLTRLSAAVFFVTPKDEKNSKKICKSLEQFGKVKFEPNEKMKLSQLQYRVTINEGTLL